MIKFPTLFSPFSEKSYFFLPAQYYISLTKLEHQHTAPLLFSGLPPFFLPSILVITKTVSFLPKSSNVIM